MNNMVIPREAGRITYSTKIRKQKLVSFNDLQKAVVVGSILGDGNLSANWSKTNYRLKISHSVKQTDYVLWKYVILKNFVFTKPSVYKKTNSISFRTISHKDLTEYYKIFYPRGNKVIPKNIKDLVKNPITVAVWFMDDGNIRKMNKKTYGYYLNTQSFSLNDNRILIEALKYNFGISSMIMENHKKYRIYIGSEGKEKFSQLIKNLIIESLRYKIG